MERTLTSQCSMQVPAAAEEAVPQPPQPKRARRGQQNKLQQAPAAQPVEPGGIPGTAAAVQLVVQLVALAGDAVQLLGPSGAGCAVQCAGQLAVPVIQQLQGAAAEAAASDQGVPAGPHLSAPADHQHRVCPPLDCATFPVAASFPCTARPTAAALCTEQPDLSALQRQASSYLHQP